jgi:hypothetical protein
MNTGQMLLTTLAIVLLGTTVITVNKSSLQHGTILQQTQIGVYGISLATSLVEEASGKAFDKNTVDAAVTLPSSLTSASSLNPESGETTTPVSTTLFNDFDDYNNLSLPVVVGGVDSFTVKAKVYYVNETAPEVKVTSPTWYKRMDVIVLPSGLADTNRIKMGLATGDTIKLSYIFSYFNFR